MRGYISTSRFAVMAAACCAATITAGLLAGDCPKWGDGASRNMVSPEQHLPTTFGPGVKDSLNRSIDLSNARNIKWVANLGNVTYSTPAVAGGKIFIGTNNAFPRGEQYRGDRGILMCFEEASGRFLWQLVVGKLPISGKFNADSADLGISSSPTVEGDRVYIVTNCGEVMCLDANGLAGGNKGPFLDEGRYYAIGRWPKSNRPASRDAADKTMAETQPIQLGPTNADIIWRFDMLAELGVWPQDATNSSVLIHGDLAYACTSNGVDSSHVNVPAPQAPLLIAVNKKTGKLVAVDDANIGPRIFHGQWSSPSLGKIGNRTLIFLGGGNGVCYAFDAAPDMTDANGGPGRLRTVWSYDCVPAEYRRRDGQPVRYGDVAGPSEIIAMPVFHNNRVYVAIGQDPTHGKGSGNLSCIDATKTGDITQTGKIWSYDKINRSVATVAVHGGLVYAADVAGKVHCLDAETGELQWTYQTDGQIWASPLVADGKVYVLSDKGTLDVLQAGRQKRPLAEVRIGGRAYATPMAANGVLYIATCTHLYAIQKMEEGAGGTTTSAPAATTCTSASPSARPATAPTALTAQP